MDRTERNGESERTSDATIEIPLMPGARTFTLEVFEGETSRLHTIDEVPKVFGSSRSAEVRLSDRTVSGTHCALSVDGDRLLVRDLGSTNGTFVGCARVEQAWASAGATITIGETQIVVHAYAEEHQRASLWAKEAPLEGIAGGSLAMRKLAARVRRLSNMAAPVLILGETGTGKELVARALHDAGRRAEGPFVPVNVAALPRDLVESLLFGHERGAFTGAVHKQYGAFGDAEQGTLFLDEIGELPLDAQPKLLRALDGYAIKRVGERGAGERADVRVIAATHKSLASDVAESRFRRDLYHRLEAFVIEIPPLRERPGDIAAIARRLLFLHADELGERSLTPGALARLSAHDWPGNVRELRNVLLRTTEVAEDPRLITEACISSVLRTKTPSGPPPEITKDYAGSLLKKARGNVAAAARAAGLPRTSFRKLVGR